MRNSICWPQRPQAGRAASQRQRAASRRPPDAVRDLELKATPLSVFGRLDRPGGYRFGAVAGDPAPSHYRSASSVVPLGIPRRDRNAPALDVPYGVGRGLPDAAYRRRLADRRPPTNAVGRGISVSVTIWPLMAKPPVIIRLCAMNCLSSSEIARPDERSIPSDSNRRCCSAAAVPRGRATDAQSTGPSRFGGSII